MFQVSQKVQRPMMRPHAMRFNERKEQTKPNIHEADGQTHPLIMTIKGGHAEKSRKVLTMKAAKLGWAGPGSGQAHGKRRAGAGPEQEQGKSRVGAGPGQEQGRSREKRRRGRIKEESERIKKKELKSGLRTHR